HATYTHSLHDALPIYNKTAFTFTVHRNDFKRAQEVLRGVTAELGAGEVGGDTKIAKVSIVGVGMRSHAGVATKMFEALSNEGIRSEEHTSELQSRENL